MKITWFGTASILIEAAGERILFDPFVQLKGGENPNSLDDFIHEKYICITHGHLDHLMEIPEFLDTETEGEATVYCGSVAAKTLQETVPDTSNVVEVRPGMRWKIGGIELSVLKGKHSVQTFGLKAKTLCSPRMVKYAFNAIFMASVNRQFPEGGETFVYELSAEGKRIQVLGSLSVSEQEDYQPGADLLVLPFQGSSHPEKDALCIVEKLQPRRVMLSHFDDAFPPVSRTIDTRKFKSLMDERFPQIPVVKPTVKKTITI